MAGSVGLGQAFGQEIRFQKEEGGVWDSEPGDLGLDGDIVIIIY